MSSNDVSCDRIGPLVEAYRDGLLDGHERELVAAHLSVCSECAEGDSDLRADSLFPEHRIDARAVAREGRWRERPVLQPSLWRRNAGAFAAAAAAVVLVAGSSFLAFRSDPGQVLGDGSGSQAGSGSGSRGSSGSARDHAAPESPRPMSHEILTEKDCKLKVGKPSVVPSGSGSGSGSGRSQGSDGSSGSK